MKFMSRHKGSFVLPRKNDVQIVDPDGVLYHFESGPHELSGLFKSPHFEFTESQRVDVYFKQILDNKDLH